MTQPYPQAQYPAAQPGYPTQQYAPAPPAAPQYPQPQPGYPTAPQAYPPQQFAPQYPQAPGYPQAPQGQQIPAGPPLATGTLDGYFSQPSSGGGAALKFTAPTPSPAPGYPDIPGTTHVGVVARPITNADIQQQTQPGSGLPATYRDGRPKFVMKVPLQVQPGPEHPDGLAQWYVAGGARDELVRAMSAAGAPEGPPEAGAVISVTCTGTRASGAGMNPAKTYAVTYQRPAGVSAGPGVQQQADVHPPASAPQPLAPMATLPPQGPPVAQYQAPAPQPPPPVAQFQPPAPVPQPPAAPVAPAAIPPGFTAEQAAKLAELTGQPAPAA